MKVAEGLYYKAVSLRKESLQQTLLMLYKNTPSRGVTELAFYKAFENPS